MQRWLSQLMCGPCSSLFHCAQVFSLLSYLHAAVCWGEWVLCPAWCRRAAAQRPVDLSIYEQHRVAMGSESSSVRAGRQAAVTAAVRADTSPLAESLESTSMMCRLHSSCRFAGVMCVCCVMLVGIFSQHLRILGCGTHHRRTKQRTASS